MFPSAAPYRVAALKMVLPMFSSLRSERSAISRAIPRVLATLPASQAKRARNPTTRQSLRDSAGGKVRLSMKVVDQQTGEDLEAKRKPEAERARVAAGAGAGE